MKEKIEIIMSVFLGLLCSTFIVMTVFVATGHYLKKDEYIKQLEQSLNEQIQEKEVYIKMLEEENEEN